MRPFLQSTLLGVLNLSAALFAGPASAYETSFGQDLNGSAVKPLETTPNASAAETTFLSKLGTSGTETFERIGEGQSAPLTLEFQGVGSATLTGSTGRVVKVPSGESVAGRYSVPSGSTTNFWEVAAGTTTGRFTVDFGPSAIEAFGFYGIDVGDFGGSLQLELVKASGGTTRITIGNAIDASADGAVLFFGVIADDPAERFTSVNFLTTQGEDDFFAFDNFTIGELKRDEPVPEPGSLALVAFGLAALGAATRRRTR